MANRIKFKDVRVGQTYFVQSRYWNKVLGTAKITEVSRCDSDPDSGEVVAICDWSECSDSTVYLDSAWDWFWDELPSECEQKTLVKEFWEHCFRN